MCAHRPRRSAFEFARQLAECRIARECRTQHTFQVVLFCGGKALRSSLIQRARDHRVDHLAGRELAASQLIGKGGSRATGDTCCCGALGRCGLFNTGGLGRLSGGYRTGTGP